MVAGAVDKGAEITVGLRARTQVDADLQRRRDVLVRELCAREAPRVLLLFTVIIVLFDVGFAAIGVIAPVGYYVSDLIQGGVNAIVAVLIMRGVITARWAPAAFVSAIVVDNLALNYQYTLVGYSAVGVTLLTMTVYGAVTLVWRPFLISAAWMGVFTSWVLIANDPETGLGWSLTAITALVVSGVVLYGRRAAVLPLAYANRTIEELATRDALTGLLNRHGLEASSDVLTSLARRQGSPLFAVFVDITGLKRVNDEHGHLAGDEVIRRTAAALQAQVRSSDLLCRWGGDEFLLMGIGDAPDPDEVAERTVSRIDATGLEGVWTPQVAVGTAATDEYDLTSLVEQSDTAMYGRKREGS